MEALNAAVLELDADAPSPLLETCFRRNGDIGEPFRRAELGISGHSTDDSAGLRLKFSLGEAPSWKNCHQSMRGSLTQPKCRRREEQENDVISDSMVSGENEAPLKMSEANQPRRSLKA